LRALKAYREFHALCFLDFVASSPSESSPPALTFAVNTSRVQLVRALMSRENFASWVDRPVGQAEALAKRNLRPEEA
jgi:hypothetical protein